jgi:hypothetical protein
MTDAMYANGESNTNKVLFMNKAQREMSPYFGLIATDSSITTLADDDEYSLPTGISDITQIEYLEVADDVADTDLIVTSADMKVGSYTIANQPAQPSLISVTITATGSSDTMGTVTVTGTVGGTTGVTESITPVAGATTYGTKYFSYITSIVGAGWVTNGDADKITCGVSLDRYAYTKYNRNYKDFQTTKEMYSFSQLYSSAGVKTLILYPAPAKDGLQVNIRYHKALTDLDSTSLSSSPSFDERFHHLLAIYACYMICSTGSSPDTVQADRFIQDFQDGLTNYWRLKMEQDFAFPKKPRDNRHWRRN